MSKKHQFSVVFVCFFLFSSEVRNLGVLGKGFSLKEGGENRESNEFIKLKMHEAAERFGSSAQQTESELPSPPGCTHAAPLIASSCLGDTKSSQATTW